MPYLKIIMRALLAIVLLAVVLTGVIYFGFLTPEKRAAKHLDFIHQSITEMHPAVLDPAATEFHAWYKTGYEKAKALLPLVHSAADERALLNYYFAGYKDSHLSGYIASSIYDSWDSSGEQWSGWLLKATMDSYEVVYSLGGEHFPESGLRLVSCNNQPIEELLQSRYAPYVDMRSNLLLARDSVAKALTQKNDVHPILERPEISQCLFKNKAGEEKQYAFGWNILDEKSKRQINTLNSKQYTYPSVIRKRQDIAWINVSDFQLATSEAYAHHQQLLKDLRLLNGDETLVFDFRLNSGGNSGFGNELLAAAFGEEGGAYLEAQLEKKYGAAESFYRPSWSFYWSRDYTIKQLKLTQGESSSQVKWLSAINERMKKALDNNEQQFSQREALAEFMGDQTKMKPATWRHLGKIIVITDKRCVSACLDFLDRLKQISQLHHWGEPTSADTQYTEITYMWHDYHKEAYSFMVPVKRWTHRPRKDNEPYIPDALFEGNIYDDKALEQWVFNRLNR